MNNNSRSGTPHRCCRRCKRILPVLPEMWPTALVCTQCHQGDLVGATCDPTKICTNCGIAYPRDVKFFHGSKVSPDGLRTQCRSCLAQKERLRKSGSPEPRKAKAKSSTQKCIRCEQYHLRTMEFFPPKKHRKSFAENDGVKLSRTCVFCVEQSQRTRDEKAAALKQMYAKKVSRECTHCKVLKPLHPDFFNTAKNDLSGYTATCKQCQSEKSAKARAVDPEKTKEKAREGRMRRKAADPIGYALKSRAKKSNHRKAKKKKVGVITHDEIGQVISFQNWQCFYCSKPINFNTDYESQITVDHVIPISKGGKNEVANIVCACRACNNSKSDRWPWAWMAKNYCQWLTEFTEQTRARALA